MSQLATIPHIKRDAPLGPFTAARLGGAADWLYVARESYEALVDVVRIAWDEGLPVRVIGGGANILVSDAGVRGLVVVNRIADIEFGDWHDGRNVAVSAGLNLLKLARITASKGLSGMEWAIGVPGTVGGAIVNNAGAHGADMAQSVVDVVIYDADRGAQLLTQDGLAYDYRHSALKSRADRRFVVLMANLALTPDDPAVIDQRMQEYNAYRKNTQPPGASLGSIFKNPDGDYAGRLIESCDLKGLRVGQVQVSPIHANFFVNSGDATATDYLTLIRQVQQTVFEQTGVQLELEIEIVGDWPDELNP